ncbi:MAG: hypothetical protein DBX36_03825 [Oscillospiraceae bacterium]|nr:MAG: hypothetical protein DBX36_03825 [Oscillospiraceae bacterium]
MNKLTREDLIVLLSERNETKYAAALNELRNIGNSNLAVTKMYGYSVGDDLVIVYHYCFDGCHFYFEISDFNNLIYFYNEIESIMKSAKEILFSSDSPDIFQNSQFINLFGKHDIIKQESFGMLSPVISHERDKNIRRLTIEDEKIVSAFYEPLRQYRDNLKNAFETRIKTNDKNCIIYAYIDNETDILGYLIVDTFDGYYWDISYIYVSENSRGKGIAKKLAAFYANDVIENGYFASYGVPENEDSKKVAVSVGFEMFERRYFTQWMLQK